MFEPFQLPFVQRGLIEVLILSVGGGLLGVWIVLRGLAFYTHAVGTAAFPGLVLADGLGFAPPLGAFAAAACFSGSVQGLSAGRRDGQDGLTALSLAGALALGTILASDVFHSAARVESLLFGSLLAIGDRDLVLAALATCVALVATVILGSRWLAVGFDREGARALGVRPALSDGVLLLLIALVTIAALSAVGALLTSALIVVPAATVRLWISRIGAWQVATVVLAACEGTVGLWLSVKTDAPPGATIAVLAGGVFAVAALADHLNRTQLRRLLAVFAALAGSALVLGACGTRGSDGGPRGTAIDVIATTTQIGDWVQTVGGQAVDLHRLLKPNTDPHDYEPRPSDVEAIANARLVFVNGDGLDSWIERLVEQSGGDPRVVDLGNAVRAQTRAAGSEALRNDPHWWHDPHNAVIAVRDIRDGLTRTDPAGAQTFRSNARSYVAQLKALDRGIAACVRRVPPSQRKLVTDHDAFGYFADRYGIRVVGTVIPSQTTQAQPSGGDLSDLVKQIGREHVLAIFPEHALSSKLATAVARETGARADLSLYGDALGPGGSPGDTYLKMEAANADAIVRGFTGDRVRCRVGAR